MFDLFIIPSKNGQDLTPEEIRIAISEQKHKVFILPLDAKIEFIGSNVEIKSPSNKSK